MISSLTHRGSLTALKRVAAFVAFLACALVVQSFAQESWSYSSDRGLSVPPPPLPLVPGSWIGELGEGLTVNTGVSLTYDNNQFKTRDNESASTVMTSDLSLHYARGESKRRGLFFGADFNIAYFDYFDEPKIGGGTLAAGETLPEQSQSDERDPFEFGYSGYVGLRGAKTTITLNGTFDQDNGNSTDQRRQQRESLRQSSTSYLIGLDLHRQLSRGSLQVGFGYSLQDYDEPGAGEAGSVLGPGRGVGTGLADLSQWDGNVGWGHQPQATPKTSFQLGVGFGGSEQQDGGEDTNINPSVGVTYRYSPKTSLFANGGVSIRKSKSTVTSVVPATPSARPASGVALPVPEPMTISEEQSFTQTTPTFGFGGSWNPDETTSLSIRFNQSTSASALRGQSSYSSRGVTLTGSKQFPRGYFASLDYSLEDTGYTDSSGTEDSTGGRPGTPDKYSRLGLTVGRQVQLRPSVSLSMSTFYQYNVGRGDDVLSEFEQSVAGIRLGLSF
jgi:hypothetical protein